MGADFRTAKDVFALVKAIFGCLHEWGTSKLDILINNAVQTLTDSIEREERPEIQREWLMMSTESGDRLVQDNDTDYTLRLRGGQSDRLLREQQCSKPRTTIILGAAHVRDTIRRVGGAAERAKRALAAMLGQRGDQRDDWLGDRFRLSLIRSLKSNIYTNPLCCD
jgi:hypothetical protein